MVTDSELTNILDSPELKDLLMSAASANQHVLIERDLLRRRGEIELELSSMTAACDEATANMNAANFRANLQLDPGLHKTRLLISLLVLGLGLFATLNCFIFDWSAGKQVIVTWGAPFTSGRVAAAVWIVLYGAFVVAAFETHFYLRRLPTLKQQTYSKENIEGYQEALVSAQAARDKQLIALVRDHVSEIINSNQGPIFRSTLHVRSGSSPGQHDHVTLSVGLSEVANDDNRIATNVQHDLVQLISNLPGASIGISGPRGVGKSTLLTALCSANPTIKGRTAIAINASAPVEYDSREFLLHLFSSLCRQVLRTEGQEAAIKEERVAQFEAQRWRAESVKEALLQIRELLLSAGLVMVLVAFVFAMLSSLPSFDQLMSLQSSSNPQAAVEVTPNPTHTTALPLVLASTMVNVLKPVLQMFKEITPTPFFTLGISALMLAFAISLSARRFSRSYARDDYNVFNYSGHHYELQRQAMQELRNIAFQRSYTSGWSGSLKAPVGLDMTSNAGLTLAQRPESLPELVERFRSFVLDVAQAYDNVVLIGIDELDKLKNAQQAETFLNGIKSVFGISRCFYLISVSEHALAAFERCGIGFRDAFDSALDDIVQIGFLDLDQSRVLLNRRILRLPDPFLQLCHMLSGGLPRDLIRHARALLHCASQMPDASLSLKSAVDQMVERDLTARLRATTIAMRAVNEIPETSDFLVKVASLPSVGEIKVAEKALVPFRTHISGLSRLRSSDEGRVLLRIAEEMAVYYEVMIQLRRVAELLSTREGWVHATKLRLADQVAEVRQALEVGVPLAEARLSELHAVIDNNTFAISSSE